MATDAGAVLGIHYPERAEGVGDYKDYKVFVEFWDPLVEQLSSNYRRLVLRRETRILGVFGEQGAGKTLFANQLKEDFEAAKGGARPDPQNVWHAITSVGKEAVSSPRGGAFVEVDEDVDWVQTLVDFVKPVDRDVVAVADNTETHYFLRGLAGDRVPDGDRHDINLVRVAAERLVRLARNELRGVMLILLSNDERYLGALNAEVEAQHAGLMTMAGISLPSSQDKERAVRVNINRLNPVSYWYCLDRGGLPQKKDVYNRLADATTFPKAFEAVDAALQSGVSRTGRPPRRNLLTLICLSGAGTFDGAGYAIGPADVEALGPWHVSLLHDKGWATSPSLSSRETSLLESEWQFRLIVLGAPFVEALLTSDPSGTDSEARNADACLQLLNIAKTPLGGTSTNNARETYRIGLGALANSWPAQSEDAVASAADFWRRDQARSTIYEPKLKTLLTSYDVKTPGFLDARPDWVIEDYAPCSVLSAAKLQRTELNQAIRREAHAVEFTAQKSPTVASITAYLESKLPNYVAATQNQ
jgi:hypothetical protein